MQSFHVSCVFGCVFVSCVSFALMVFMDVFIAPSTDSTGLRLTDNCRIPVLMSAQGININFCNIPLHVCYTYCVHVAPWLSHVRMSMYVMLYTYIYIGRCVVASVLC